jgi:hypothetical protein
MSLFFYLLCLFPEQKLVKSIKVDNLGIFLSQMNSGRIFLQQDGTVLAASKYQVWHWDREGKLINRIGRKGEGPGEFQSPGSMVWNGQYYWIVDHINLFSSLFDSNGQFLSRKQLYFRQFVFVADRIFAVDYRGMTTFRKFYPQTLQEIRWWVENNEIRVEETDLRFVKVFEKQVELVMNFKLLWLAGDEERFLVVNQLEPRIYVYDRATREREDMVPEEHPFQPKFFALRLPHWVDPPDSFKFRHGNHRAFMSWWQSWSRINYFGEVDGGFVVAYEIPDENEPTNSLQVIQTVDKKGRAVGEPLVSDGICFGIWGGLIHLFREGDSEESFDYYIDLYKP